MKLDKDYTKEPHLFLVNDTTLLSDNPLRFKTYKMTISEKIKTVDSKIKQNKAQYD